MGEKMRIALPIIVEGKYDKNTLSQILDARIVALGGFSVFNSREKQSLVRTLAEAGGVILLTDSDGGGLQIRKFLLGILPRDKVINLYIPKIEGKERRKRHAGKAGLLGVEGMDRETVEKIFAPFAAEGTVSQNPSGSDAEMLTKVDFFTLGLSGADDAASRRDRLAVYFGLPDGMTAKALVEALNIISCRTEVFAAAEQLFGTEE